MTDKIEGEETADDMQAVEGANGAERVEEDLLETIEKEVQRRSLEIANYSVTILQRRERMMFERQFEQVVKCGPEGRMDSFTTVELDLLSASTNGLRKLVEMLTQYGFVRGYKSNNAATIDTWFNEQWLPELQAWGRDEHERKHQNLLGSVEKKGIDVDRVDTLLRETKENIEALHGVPKEDSTLFLRDLKPEEIGKKLEQDFKAQLRTWIQADIDALTGKLQGMKPERLAHLIGPVIRPVRQLVVWEKYLEALDGKREKLQYEGVELHEVKRKMRSLWKKIFGEAEEDDGKAVVETGRKLRNLGYID